MAEFTNALKRSIGYEGGYSNVEDDSGGITYAGITQRNFPNLKLWDLLKPFEPLKYNEIVSDTAIQSEVASFYLTNFWNKMSGNLWTSQRCAELFFDWFINSASVATKKLQGVLNIAADGIFGSGTLVAVNACNEDDLFDKLKAERIKFYNDHCAVVPDDAKFLQGWLNRVNKFI